MKASVTIKCDGLAVHDIRLVPETFIVEILKAGAIVESKVFSTGTGLQYFTQALHNCTLKDRVNILVIGPPGAGKTTGINAMKTVKEA
jgi:hypothetical protein